MAAHALGVVTLARGLRRVGGTARKRGRVIRHPVAVTVGMVGAIGWVLAIFHGIARISLLGRNRLDEGCHVVFCRLDHDPRRLGLNLEPEWQMMGALEAADGMLLFGISTAFVFVVIQQIEQVISQVEDYDS
jgi:hypothetical protein